MSELTETTMETKNSSSGFPGKYWYLDILLLLVILAGGYLRTVGMNWDEDQHLHPDERFLTMVESDISPVNSLGEYFDTDNSSLNPHNRGHSFFVYGDFPIILVRYIAEWVGHTDYYSVHLVGRYVSAVFDMLTLLLIYLIGTRMYDRRIGLLAAAFYAFAVLPLQLSHFFAVDTFLTFFVTLAIYAAVSLYQHHKKAGEADMVSAARPWAGIGWYLLFGLALGLAMASKVSAVPLAIILPVAAAGWVFKLPREHRLSAVTTVFVNLVMAAALSLLVFRVAQPYAFSGPGFFGIQLNEKWLSNLKDLQAQSSGAADFPPSLQWARRPRTFALDNLIRWGMGYPLGILVWVGFLWMAVRMWKNGWEKHLPIWLWSGMYFLWQSMAWNPMMRYTIPVYPTLVIIGAWAVISLWDLRRKAAPDDVGTPKPLWTARLAAVIIGLGVLAATTGWGYAFTRIYTRPVTRVEASRWIYQNIPGPITLNVETDEGEYHQPIPYPTENVITPENPLEYDFNANRDGSLQSLQFFRLRDGSAIAGEKELTISIWDVDANIQIGQAQIRSEFTQMEDQRGSSYSAAFEKPIPVQEGKRYRISLHLTSGSASLVVARVAPANESDWDDGLPLRIDGYDGYGGIYEGGLNFQMYWDDNEEKRDRFIGTLNSADYIFISSNRQWGTTTRIPERYPMSTAFYQALVGCPDDVNLLVCYSQAEPGMYAGQLGFDLVEVFQSNPSIGTRQRNDQLAEEAFTVYDHPKVFIFKKSADYDASKVRQFFNAIDLSMVIHTALNEVPFHPQTLMLPADRLAQQQAGGTWSALFDWNALQNKYPGLGVIIWYLAILLLGWISLPAVMLAFPGLQDRGYGFARLVGMLVVALITWLAGSYEITFSRLTISVVVGVWLLFNLALVWLLKQDFRDYLRGTWKQILAAEGVFLLFFMLMLLVRLGNPDLWHASKGGEKPMDFAYLNAVIKSTSFPPYDPWFAGGYINYYYYGFVIVGTLVKWLGVVPAIAYNFILPTLFGLLATGAYTIISTVVYKSTEQTDDGKKPLWRATLLGITGAVFTAVMGNLGTVRMIWRALQKLGAPDGDISGVGFITRMAWTVKGFGQVLQGNGLPLYPGDWYWIPSRAIPAVHDVEPITEFPAFTFLYADLHAHMIALPISMLVIGWLVSLLYSRGKWQTSAGKFGKPGMGISLFIGAIAVGALRPTNTWDFPVYLALAVIGILYTLLRHRDSFSHQPGDRQHWVWGVGMLLALPLLAFVLYQPFTQWYGAAYTAVDLWIGDTTPSWSYLTHWGVFLFFIVSWMIYETIDWMASTPLRVLARYRPYFFWFIVILALVALILIGFLIVNAYIAWIALPIAAWALILILRRDQPDIKRMFLFFVGTSMVLTIFVEVVVLRGDIGRMNTVFKFYLQVWTLLSLASAAALYWLIRSMAGWRPSVAKTFQSAAWLLVGSAMLFPLLAGADKIRDRMVDGAPHTLDGMQYMIGATYLEHNINTDETMVMQLEQDYHAIRWMQDNVQGSPVIVEGLVTEYRWGSRYSINTGLPAVVGWNWHQRQQRAVNPSEWVTGRVAEVDAFYTTSSVEEALDFIHKYDVEYIIVGQMEQAVYPLSGLAKFFEYEGVYWNPVYTYQQTTIYQVIH